MSKDPYYVCELINGDVLDFDNLCNNLTTWNDGTIIEFRHRFVENNRYASLGFVPVNQIRVIVNTGVCEAIRELRGEVLEDIREENDWDYEYDDEDDNPFYRME